VCATAVITGIIAFAVFIDLKQFTENASAAISTNTYTTFEAGFALITAAWIANLVGAGASLASSKSA
jgi:hypothetical protein